MSTAPVASIAINPRLRAALSYVARGWLVFPCFEIAPIGKCSCGDHGGGRCSPGKHPRVTRGIDDATTDPEQIAEWWSRWPRANVAIRTGRESGIVVLDIDPRHGGGDSVANLKRRHGQLLETVTSLTGGGGLHYLFAHPGDREIRNRTNLGGYRGVDFKADRGFIIAPPSNHASGGRYEWDSSAGLAPENLPLAPAPEWLLELAEQGPDGRRTKYQPTRWTGETPDTVAYWVAVSPKVGRRFHRSAEGLVDCSPSGVDFGLACLLAKCGLPGAEIEAGLKSSRARAGLPDRPGCYFDATVGKALRLAQENSRGAA